MKCDLGSVISKSYLNEGSGNILLFVSYDGMSWAINEEYINLNAFTETDYTVDGQKGDEIKEQWAEKYLVASARIDDVHELKELGAVVDAKNLKVAYEGAVEFLERYKLTHIKGYQILKELVRGA